MPASVLIGAFLFGLGVILNLWMVIAGGWPTYYWFLLMGIGLLAIGAGLWSRGVGTGTTSWFKRHLNGIGLAVVIGFFVVMGLFMGAKSRETYWMRWTYGESPSGQPDRRHIILMFETSPSYSVGLYSNDLGTYLESTHSERVPVVFDVTRDFGSVRGFQEVQIGTLTQWDSSGGYASVRDGGKNPKSPWGWRLF